MAGTVLVSGGAGFIGSHVCDALLAGGWDVRVLDNLSEQVHGREVKAPPWLDPDVDFRLGDIRDPDAVALALKGTDAVVHLASAVGAGQSLRRIAEYTSVNELGTATLLEALADHPVERLVVASCMSVYGEGRCVDSFGLRHDHVERRGVDLEAGLFDPADSDGEPLVPVATPEDKPPCLSSVHALHKFAQERMALIAGRACQRPTVALRFFHTYGPRQALSSARAGVLAVFARQLLDGERPRIFEDGHQLRDFVSVHDVAAAVVASLERPHVDGEVLNIGSGSPASVRHVAELLASTLGVELQPEVLGRHRAGDIRHCYADISRARRVLGYSPCVSLADGVRELVEWLDGQRAVDRSDPMFGEPELRGWAR